MASFTEIYILDLHGNAKKSEHAEDGSIDKNVFDIQQGVAIGIFVKERNKVSWKMMFIQLSGLPSRQERHFIYFDLLKLTQIRNTINVGP